MITPVNIPLTFYRLDTFELQLNWRVRCGDTFDLSTFHGVLTLWPTKTDRSAFVYQITDPITAGEGIALTNVSPNIHAYVLHTNVDFDPVPQWYILELQNASYWIRFAEGKVTYEV